jgi:thiamine kinase-like enzyme
MTDAVQERLEAVLAAVPELDGNVVATSEISGGLINRSVKADTPGGAYVVRLFATHSELLLIDRENEHANSVIAGEAGIGARVVAYLPEHGAMVLEYIEGEAQSGDDLCAGDGAEQVARTLRRLHACDRFRSDFDMFGILRGYRRIVDEQGFRLPDGYEDYLGHAAALEEALAATGAERRPCHNDVMPANFIDVGGGFRLIDYEYSGNNDPCFDLGGIWAEAAMSPEHLDRMIREYHGGPRPEKVARARLWAIMWSYGWTLWASIQAGEGVDWDAWGWGSGHFARAVAAFDSPEFETFLASL